MDFAWFRGFSWIFRHLEGWSWIFMDFRGFWRIPMDLERFWWICVDTFWWVWSDFDGFVSTHFDGFRAILRRISSDFVPAKTKKMWYHTFFRGFSVEMCQNPFVISWFFDTNTSWKNVTSHFFGLRWHVKNASWRIVMSHFFVLRCHIFWVWCHILVDFADPITCSSCLQKSIKIGRNPWEFSKIHGNASAFMKILRDAWISVKVRQEPWKAEKPSKSMEMCHEIPRNFPTIGVRGAATGTAFTANILLLLVTGAPPRVATKSFLLDFA